MAITPDNILKYCLDNLEGVVEVRSWGERGIFYNPSSVLKRGVYVLTIKEKDGDLNLTKEKVSNMLMKLSVVKSVRLVRNK